MNILIAFNSNYCMAARVLFHSILLHNPCMIHLYVMYGELKEEEIALFHADAARSGHAKVHFIKVGEEHFADAPLHCTWITRETYYRLLAQELMPADMERFLYLDVDMVVLGSLEEFYHQSFDGKLLVACNAKKQGEIAPSVLEQRTLPPDTIYFNAGVLLYHLKAQRESIDPSILHEYPKLFYDRLPFGDQDVLNAVFYQQVKYADYHKYNMFDCEVENQAQMEQAKQQAIIFHFNGNGKPWKYQYKGECSDLFWEYAKDFSEYEPIYPGMKLAQQQYKEDRAKKEKEKEKESKETIQK